MKSPHSCPTTAHTHVNYPQRYFITSALPSEIPPYRATNERRCGDGMRNEHATLRVILSESLSGKYGVYQLEGEDGALAATVTQHPIEVQCIKVPHRPYKLRIPQPTSKAMASNVVTWGPWGILERSRQQGRRTRKLVKSLPAIFVFYLSSVTP
jgi:hypothetical protein